MISPAGGTQISELGFTLPRNTTGGPPPKPSTVSSACASDEKRKRKRFNRTGETLQDGVAPGSVFNFMVKFDSYKEDLLANMKYGKHEGVLPVFHFMVTF